MRYTIAILFCCLASCAMPKWNGAYLGVQNVDLIDHTPDGRGLSGYVNFIWNVGGRWSLQVEPIVTVDGTTILRVAVDRKIF